MEINKKIIKELRDCLDEFNLNEIEYSYKDTKIKVSKKSNTEVISSAPVVSSGSNVKTIDDWWISRNRLDQLIYEGKFEKIHTIMKDIAIKI